MRFNILVLSRCVLPKLTGDGHGDMEAGMSFIGSSNEHIRPCNLNRFDIPGLCSTCGAV